MHNVATLINKNNIKKIWNNQHTELPECNCTNKTNCPLKKCKFECIVYKVEVYCLGSNDSNVRRNIKKVYVGSSPVLLQKV